MNQRYRVCSIQSHVVSGYAGNKSAVFPLQLLGFEIDSINSVQFSNHTGYDILTGNTLNDTDLMELYRGLSSNKLNNYTHLITGYVSSESFLRSISYIVTDVKRINPFLQYVCDPVLGDDGALYVPEALIELYKKEIIPISDIITPNQYEAQLLTGLKIESMGDVEKTLDLLHQMGPQTVVLTSCSLPNNNNCVKNHVNKSITSFASRIKNDKKMCYKVEVPTLAANFIGSGDLFAALFLAWSCVYPDNLKLTLETVVSTVHVVLKKTLGHYLETTDDKNRAPKVSEIELKIVQSKKEIEKPSLIFEALSFP